MVERQKPSQKLPELRSSSWQYLSEERRPHEQAIRTRFVSGKQHTTSESNMSEDGFYNVFFPKGKGFGFLNKVKEIGVLGRLSILLKPQLRNDNR